MAEKKTEKWESAKLRAETLQLLKLLKLAWNLKSIDDVVRRLIEKAGVRVEVRLQEQ
jgi:hypothetical protein